MPKYRVYSEQADAERIVDSLDAAQDVKEQFAELAPDVQIEKVGEEEPIDLDTYEPDPTEIADAEQFATEIAGVPPAFVLSMGGKPYITKEGLTYLAARQGFEVQAEPVRPSWEIDDGPVVWKGIVRDPETERTWVDYGKAHPGKESMQDADKYLDELASTRSTNRALRLATGCGMASIEETTDGAEQSVDVVDADIEDVDSVPADGGA